MVARGIAAFVEGAVGGVELRKRWEDAAQERKDREEQKRWDRYDRFVEMRDHRRDEEDRARKQKIEDEDRARRHALEDEKLAAHREDRARSIELQKREDETYFEERGDKKAASEAHKAAKDAHKRAVSDAEGRNARRRAGLGVLPPEEAGDPYIVPGSRMERIVRSEPAAPAAPARPDGRGGVDVLPPAYNPDPRQPRGLDGAPTPDPSPTARPRAPQGMTSGEPGWMDERFGQGQVTATAQPAAPKAPMAVQAAAPAPSRAPRGMEPAVAPPGAAVAAEAPPAPAAATSVQAAVAAAPGPRRAAAAQGLGLGREPPSEDATVPDFMTFYRDVAAPKIVDRYLATGRPELAATFERWVADEGRKAGMEAWAKGVQAAERGDEGAFLDHMIDAYNADAYFDDGYDIVRSKSRLTKNGAEITFRNQATGETRKQTFDDIDDIYRVGMQWLAPEAVFEYGMKSIAAADEARAAEIEHMRNLERDAVKAGDPIQKRRQEITDKLLENDLSGEFSRNPAALRAAVDAVLQGEGTVEVSRPSGRGMVWTGD